jgi:hypothetical protein
MQERLVQRVRRGPMNRGGAGRRGLLLGQVRAAPTFFIGARKTAQCRSARVASSFVWWTVPSACSGGL